ncbi:DUF1127 domain-containing protein [Mesorhizobium sp.]|uniref:DUF1127 domain-containing protein n=1 Tax=Mesorhizobium sp. TaxID=1871066 RepID=UPI0025D86629|nr:DUF1127 domain-containing protein [Mesorhizobium sp.]
MPAGRVATPRRGSGLTALRNNIAAWRERARFRWQLKEMAQTSPHLIDDIGLTRQQAEAEIAKLPFWQR